jgi:hypothetical protein
MESGQEYLVVKSKKGTKHVPIGNEESNMPNSSKNEIKRLFTTKVSATFNLAANAKFNIVRVMKLFEAIKQVDNNTIIVAKDDPKIRMHLLGDLERNEPSFRATFKPETKNRGKQIQIVFLLESNIKVADMKRDPSMISFLNQDPKTYLNVHEWSSTNIVSIGMITHKLYDATYRMDYQKQLQEFINHAMVNENTTNTSTTKGDDASECTQPASNIPNPYMSHMTPDTTNPNTATNSQDILRIEISPIMRNHWNLDENGNKAGSPTQSMVLNVKCELQNAERITKLLYDNAKNMDKYKYGLFMSYDHARRNNELYGIMLKKNNEFHHSTQVISVYGLHEEVTVYTRKSSIATKFTILITTPSTMDSSTSVTTELSSTMVT